MLFQLKEQPEYITYIALQFLTGVVALYLLSHTFTLNLS